MAPSTRFEPSSIKNKIKRESEVHKRKKAKSKAKLEKRLARAKLEAEDPKLKQKRLAENIPRTLDNTREFDPSFLTANPENAEETSLDLAFGHIIIPGPSTSQDATSQPHSQDQHQNGEEGQDPQEQAPRVLITTSHKATKLTFDFCTELCGVFPGSQFISRQKKGKGKYAGGTGGGNGKGKGNGKYGGGGKSVEMGRIAGWAAGRGYGCLMVVNEDGKQPNGITIVHLPAGPTAYFKLTSIQLTKQIFGHAVATPHHPELVLNNFVTRLGFTVGKLFQSLFPPVPEFQGRQVVTLHNQRDFLFFRRHRYAFRSLEKVSLQEIGPRFTLKLRSLRKGLPAVTRYGEERDGLEFDDGVVDEDAFGEATTADGVQPQSKNGDESGEMPVDPANLNLEGNGDNEEEGGKQDEEWGGIEDPPSQPASTKKKKYLPPKKDEYLWAWKPELETTRRTFFL